MSLPVSFAAPIFSALSPSNGLVVGVNDNGQLDVITSVPNQLPAFNFQGVGPPNLKLYEISIMLGGQTSYVMVEGTTIVASPTGVIHPFVLNFHPENTAYTIEIPNFQPTMLWDVKDNLIFLDITTSKFTASPSTMYRISPK